MTPEHLELAARNLSLSSETDFHCQTVQPSFRNQIDGTESGEASSFMHIIAPTTSQPTFLETASTPEWYAVQTRPRHEKVVKHSLETNSIETFLPLSSQVSSWTDRRKIVEIPLFPGYIFARMTWSMQSRVRVFQTRGVVGFVGPRKEATPIPAQQIETVRNLIQARAECRQHPYLSVGQRVRIKDGALHGLQGILVRIASDCSLIVSVDLIHRSVAVRLDGYEVESL
jgi:transcription termination/antitermination protein NusG